MSIIVNRITTLAKGQPPFVSAGMWRSVYSTMQFLVARVVETIEDILTSSATISYGATPEHSRPDSVKKARNQQPFKVIACLKW
jgi:hypothetical protein